MTVVYIAGIHRSGISLIRRLLNLCGVYLGAESDLLPPGPDNIVPFRHQSRCFLLWSAGSLQTISICAYLTGKSLSLWLWLYPSDSLA